MLFPCFSNCTLIYDSWEKCGRRLMPVTSISLIGGWVRCRLRSCRLFAPSGNSIARKTVSQVENGLSARSLDQIWLYFIRAAPSRDEDREWVGQDFLVLEPELTSREWEELQEQLEELHSLAGSLTQQVQASTCHWSVFVPSL